MNTSAGSGAKAAPAAVQLIKYELIKYSCMYLPKPSGLCAQGCGLNKNSVLKAVPRPGDNRTLFRLCPCVLKVSNILRLAGVWRCLVPGPEVPPPPPRLVAHPVGVVKPALKQRPWAVLLLLSCLMCDLLLRRWLLV
jgi:hypothetical protein